MEKLMLPLEVLPAPGPAAVSRAWLSLPLSPYLEAATCDGIVSSSASRAVWPSRRSIFTLSGGVCALENCLTRICDDEDDSDDDEDEDGEEASLGCR